MADGSDAPVYHMCGRAIVPVRGEAPWTQDMEVVHAHNDRSEPSNGRNDEILFADTCMALYFLVLGSAQNDSPASARRVSGSCNAHYGFTLVIPLANFVSAPFPQIARTPAMGFVPCCGDRLR